MKPYTNAALSALGEGQRTAVLDILARLRRDGIIRTQREFRFALSRMVSAINEERERPSLRYEPVGAEVISSEMLNELFEALYFDLFGLFNHTARSAATVARQQDIQLAEYSEIQAAVRSLLLQLRSFQFLKANPEYNEVHFGEFWTKRNGYKGTNKALVDTQSSVLALQAVSSDKFMGRRAFREPTITVTHLSSQEDGSSHRFGVENAIDGDPKSFWMDVLVGESKVSTTLDGTEYDGAIVRVDVDFGRLQFMNKVSVRPFAEFPVAVLKVEYTSDGATWKELTGATSEPTLDWFIHRHARVEATGFRVYLHQPTARERTFLIPESQMRHALLWDQVVEGYYQSGFDQEALSEEFSSRADVDGDFKTYLNALKRYNDEVSKNEDPLAYEGILDEIQRQLRTVTNVLAEIDPDAGQMLLRSVGSAEVEPIEDELLSIRRVEYSLGAFEISASYDTHMGVGVWSSPKWSTPASVMEVSLDATQTDIMKVDSGGNDYGLTSVEYDVEVAPGKCVPLLPTNQATSGGNPLIQSEYLALDPTTRKGKLRFTPLSVLRVRMGDQVLGASDYTVSGRDVTIDDSAFSIGLVPTVDYTTSSANQLLDVTDTWTPTKLANPEEFEETDSDGRIQLKFVPHVSWDIIHDHETDTSKWTKPNPKISVWKHRPEADAVTVDGVSYGYASTALSVGVNSFTTSLTVTSTLGFPSEGLLVLQTTGGAKEKIWYTGTTPTSFTGLTRGYKGTAARSWSVSDAVTLDGHQEYTPVRIWVDGVEARNRTNYVTGVNPAFARLKNPDGVLYTFIQVGRTIYMDQPISNKRILVSYSHLAQYAQVHTTLRSHRLVTFDATPVVEDLRLKLKTSQR